jgi:hypothetical protein
MRTQQLPSVTEDPAAHALHYSEHDAALVSHYLAFPQAQGGPHQHVSIVFAQNFGESELKTLRPAPGVSLKEGPLGSNVEGHTCAQAVVQALQLAILSLSNKCLSGHWHVDARVCSKSSPKTD